MGSLSESAPVLTATSDYPELVVEWLPTSGPNTADGDWCDISAYVADASCTIGRNYDQDRFEAGSLSLTLRSDTRLFDPENVDGPFYGYLLPMRQIRVSQVWASVRYPVWRGFITSWGQSVPQDVLIETTISARDGFVWLEQIKLPSSAWALEIVRDDPSAWFRLGESDTVRVTDSSSNGNYGVYDNCEQGARGLVVNDADGAAAFAHSLEERVIIQNPNLITGYPFTVSAMVQVDGTDPASAKFLWSGLVRPPSFNNSVYMQIVSSAVAPAGTLNFRINDGTNTSFFISQQRIDDNQPHHIAAVVDAGATISMYIDGVAATAYSSSSGGPTWPGSPANGWVIGNLTDLLQGDYGFGTNNSDGTVHERGTIDELCVWNGTAVAADRVAAHSLAALTGWEGDTTGTRVGRFLSLLGWPETLRDIDTGISVLGAASWSVGTSALSVLQSWADTELGQFYIGPAGTLIWRSRHSQLLDASSTTSQATFVAEASGGTLQYDMDSFERIRDENLIRNPVIASRRNGVSVSVADTTLVADKYGDRTWSSPTTEDRDDAAVRDRATWLLDRYKELQTRTRSVRISPRRDPANLWPQVLGRQIGDRITIKRTPLGEGSEVSVEQIIERVTHRFSPTVWQTTWQCSAVNPNVGDYLILDDATYGLLDTAALSY